MNWWQRLNHTPSDWDSRARYFGRLGGALIIVLIVLVFRTFFYHP